MPDERELRRQNSLTLPAPPSRDDETNVGLIRQCLPWTPESAAKDNYSQREGETVDDTRARCQRRVAELAEELEMLKEVLACSEIENVERIAAQLHEAKKEADRTAGEAAAAVAVAQGAAERVTALAIDLEHAKAEADSFALIAELEAAKEDADNAAEYWSYPTDAGDCRVYCDGETSSLQPKGDSAGMQHICSTLPTISSANVSIVEDIDLSSSKPESKDEPKKFDSLPQMLVSPSSTVMKEGSVDNWGAGCYLVFEDQNQGTLTATWSRTTPA